MKNLKKSFILFLIIFPSLICVSRISAGEYLTPIKKKAVLNIQSQLYNDQFENALHSSDSLIKNYPDDPVGYLFKAAVFLAMMTDAEENRHEIIFKNLVDTVLNISEIKINSPDSNYNAWMLLWRGHAHAYKSLWESRFGSFSSAVKQGFDAKDDYDKGLGYDSSLYDLYGGIGLYHYWKSAKTGILRWLGIFKNDKQKGISELYLTIDSSLISSYTAENALIWVWLDKKEYDSVIVICRRMLTVFTDGKLFLWPLAQAYSKKNEYQKAAEIYLKIREKLLPHPGNYFNLIECDFAIVRNCEKLNKKDTIKKITDNFVTYYSRISKDISWKQRNKISYLKRAAI